MIRRFRVSKWIALSVAITVAVVLAAVAWFTGVGERAVRATRGAFVSDPDRDVARWVKRAENAESVGDFDKAFRCLQMALVCATNDVLRSRAGLAMGRLFLMRAGREVHPYAFMAREYLQAAANLGADAETKLAAYRGILQASGLLRDMPGMLAAGAAAAVLLPGDNERAELLLSQMNACLRFGARAEMARLVEAAEPFKSLPAWTNRFEEVMRASEASLIMRRDWFDDYARRNGMEAAKALRASILAAHKERHRQAVKSGLSESQILESALDLALFCREMGDTEESERYLQMFLAGEPSSRLEEALLLSIGTARDGGRLDASAVNLKTYLDRYGWGETAGLEGLALAEAFEKAGRPVPALEIIDLCIRHMASASWRDPRFAAKAARLASKLALFDQADGYLRDLAAEAPPADLLAKTLDACVEACLERGELKRADDWLTSYLTRYARHNAFIPLLIRLFDVRSRHDASPVAVAVAGLAAAERAPDAGRAAEIMVYAASALEREGALFTAYALYRKADLLAVAGGRGGDRASALPVRNDLALLGRARCLLEVGETVKADRLFREASHFGGDGGFDGESSIAWARIAEQQGQIREARRRLDLAVSPAGDSATRNALDAMERELAFKAAQRTEAAGEELLSAVKLLESPAHAPVAMSGFEAVFESFAGSGDSVGMRKTLEAARESSVTAGLPLRAWAWRTAAAILDREGLSAFLAWTEQHALLVGDGATGKADLLAVIRSRAENIVELGGALAAHQ